MLLFAEIMHYKKLPITASLLILLPLFHAPMGVLADEPAAQTTQQDETQASISLEQLLKNTLANSGQIQESMQDIEIARAQLDQARAAMWPKASAIVLAAPIFEERGNATASTANWSKWGPFFKGGLEIAQPLYTFGQIGSYKRAAESQIIAREGQADMKRAEVLLTTKEFYYGFQMAKELENLVDDLIKFLEEAVETAEETLAEKKKSSTIKPHDVFRLKTALEDLRQKKLLAKQSRQTAERAIAWVTGTRFEHLATGPLASEKFEKKSLDDYLKAAKARRPEFRALAAGQQARSALGDAKQAQSYPVLFVGALAGAGWSPVRDRQQSIYANDPFNRLEGGAGIGLKFDLEFARHSAEAAEQRAEAMKLKATESYAVPGIELQVKRAYWELEQAVDGLEVAERRRSLGKKWFVSNAMGWSIGITPAKDLLEALEGNGLAKKNYVETLYQLNMALAKLTLAVGDEVTQLKYR